MKVVGYSSWAPDERANAMRLAFKELRVITGQDWSLRHFGASEFNDPAAIGDLRRAIREADILVGWQSMSVEVVERLAALLGEMDAAGELSRLKFLWYDIPDPRLQGLMFKSLGFEFDMNKSNPMREMSMALKRFSAKRNDEKIDAFWEAREGFLGMQKMVGAAPLMAKLMKKPVFKSLVMIGYWNNRSVKNVANMFLYLMKHFMNGAYAGDVELPERVENEGIYHPAHAGLFPTSEAYLAWYEPWFEQTYAKAPWERIGFITHDLFLVDWNHPVLDAAIAEWERRGVGVICSMTAVFNAHIVSRGHLLSKKGEPLVGAVYHNVPLYLAGSMFAGAPEASIELIHALGNPRVYTSPVNAAMSRAELALSKFGVASLEYIGNVVTPETEGIQPMPPICSREAGEEISALEPIPDRVALLGDVTTRWLKLRHLKNADKKIACFVYNFPPGPGNVGVAYFLDVAGSLRSMLLALRDAGYNVGDVDATDAEVSQKLRDMYAGYLNVGAVSAGEIREWAHALPPKFEALFYDVWGQPQSTIPIKGLRYGNVLVLLQDMQGMDDLSVIHDKQAPPSPWLLASYRYATRRFNADAMVHVGTHGLVEWSRGKEWCPASGDYPEFLVDGCPHAYVFNILDPVEASIARRRSYATILSHLCPPLRAVEGSEDLRNLHRLVHDYYNTQSDNLEKRADLQEEIAEVVERTGLRIEAPGGASREFVAKVHDELVSLVGEFAPTGQHVFGRNLAEQDRLDTFHACLEYADVDLYRLLANCYGFDYEKLTREPNARTAGTYHHEIVDALREAGRALLSSEVLRPAGGGVDSRIGRAPDRGAYARDESGRDRATRSVRRTGARPIPRTRARRRRGARRLARGSRRHVSRAVARRRNRRRLERLADGPQHGFDRRTDVAARSRAAQGQTHRRPDSRGGGRRARRVSGRGRRRSVGLRSLGKRRRRHRASARSDGRARREGSLQPLGTRRVDLTRRTRPAPHRHSREHLERLQEYVPGGRAAHPRSRVSRRDGRRAARMELRQKT
jgi:cobalamin biosynthesis Mg chelatase CobN